MDATDLATYANANAADAAFVASCWAQAVVLVDAHIGSATVPAEIHDRACLEVGSELFHRRHAPNGISQFATPDGTSPIRVARDPMVAAYPLLTRFVGFGFSSPRVSYHGFGYGGFGY